MLAKAPSFHKVVNMEEIITLQVLSWNKSVERRVRTEKFISRTFKLRKVSVGIIILMNQGQRRRTSAPLTSFLI